MSAQNPVPLSFGLSSPEVPGSIYNFEENEGEKGKVMVTGTPSRFTASYTSAQKDFEPKIPYKNFKRLAGGGKLLYNLLTLQMVCAALYLIRTRVVNMML